jgi:hypothetical protein
MVTWLLPPNNGRSFSSALMARRFLASCRPFLLMYAQSLLMTWVRGIGLLPMTAASFALGVNGLMNAGFGLRLAEDFLFALLAVFFRAAGRFARFLADFLPAVFLLLVAIASLPKLGENRVVPREPAELPCPTV